MINWRSITGTTKTPIMRTLTGLASNVTSPRKDVRKIEETSVQKVGMQEDGEKKICKPYTS